MASTKYTYSVADDTANAKANVGKLGIEIAASSIVTALDYIDISDDVLDIWMKDSLSAGDQTTLGTVVGAHDGVADQDSHFDDEGNQYVRPSAPKNEHGLRRYGLEKAYFDSSDQATAITLSNKSGQTFTYSCTRDPVVGDLIYQSNATKRARVASVNTGSTQLTIGTADNDFDLDNAAGVISTPVVIGYQTVGSGSGFWYLWGLIVSGSNFHNDDVVLIRITDPQNLLGYGAGTVILEYDEVWMQQLDKCGKMLTPDGAPGQVLKGLQLELVYYPYDTSSTNISVWNDWIITEKS